MNKATLLYARSNTEFIYELEVPLLCKHDASTALISIVKPKWKDHLDHYRSFPIIQLDWSKEEVLKQFSQYNIYRSISCSYLPDCKKCNGRPPWPVYETVEATLNALGYTEVIVEPLDENSCDNILL